MTTEDKQRFLYEEIIDAGLDAEEFQMFLQNKNPEAGLDITRWEFSELKKIVRQFQAKDKEPSSPVKTQSRPPVEQPPPPPQPVQPKEPITQSQPSPLANPVAKQQPPKQPEPKVGFGQKVPIKPKTAVEEKKPEKPVAPPKQPQISPKPNTQKKKEPERQITAEKKQPPAKPQVKAEVKPEVEEKRQPDRIEPQPAEDQYSNVDNLTKEQIFSRSLNCERMELSLLFNIDVSVEIKKYEIVEGGLFSQTYAIYTIETPKQGWSVTRRYSDFVWLRETLEKLHPGLPIPPIANKSSYRKFTERHLRRRMMIMETFLNKILTVPDLKGEPVICEFLRVSDNLEYLKLKKAFTVEQRIRLEKLKTLKGKVNLVIEPKISKLISLARQNLTNSEPKLRKIYKQAKAVSKLLDGGANLLESISKTFQELSQEYNLFNKTSQLNIKSSTSYLYDIMKGLTHDLAKTFTDQSEMIYKHFYGTFKYECINMMSMTESLGKLEMSRCEYRDYKNKLRRTKEKLLQDRNYAKWGMNTVQTERLMTNKEASFDKNQLLGMMLPKETEQEIQLKEYYALTNFQVYEEISRFAHHNPKFISGLLLDMSKKESRLSSESMMLWADTMTNVMSFQQGKRVYEMEIAQAPGKK